MNLPMRRVLLATSFVGVGAVILALTVVPSPEQRQEVDHADQVAQQYRRELSAYVGRLGDYVAKRLAKDGTNYQKLHDELMNHLPEAPRIPVKGVTAYAREHSRDYRTAAERRSLELMPFRAFAKRLEAVSIPRQKFVDAGVKLVKLNPLKLLQGYVVQFSGEPLRTEVVPAYKKARKRLLEQHHAPTEDELARDLKTYADDVIDMTEKGADDIDAGRPFFFDFGDRPKALLGRLAATQRTVAADVSAQVDALPTSGSPRRG
jgi:hypothetical protein